MENTEASLTNYLNATDVKLKNKRVVVEDMDNGNYGLMFKILTNEKEAHTPSAKHFVKKGRVKITTLQLSPEAAMCLYEALRVRFLTREKYK